MSRYEVTASLTVEADSEQEAIVVAVDELMAGSLHVGYTVELRNEGTRGNDN